MEIGLAYEFDVRSDDVPAGCYWRSYGQVYFNKITDPSQTNLGNEDYRGGLCMPSSKP